MSILTARWKSAVATSPLSGMADYAYITPHVFRWARETARISRDTAAGRVSVSVARLDEWESGLRVPTFRQARTLALLYRRPLALFFLPDIPSDFLPLQDFRTKDVRELGTGAVFIIREIQQGQAWVRESRIDEGETARPFVGRFTIDDNPVAVANDITDTLGIIPGVYPNDKPIREWIDRSEHQGIFVSRTSFIHPRLPIDPNELQGFAIADPYAPFVFVNSADWATSQLFTLVHELAHIWVAATGISNDVERLAERKNKLHPVELFCNEVAANALMPMNLMDTLNRQVFRSSRDVFLAAGKIGVSSFALLVRALSLGRITLEEYHALKHGAETDYRAYLTQEEDRHAQRTADGKAGGPSYYLLQLNRNGRAFTREVIDAFRGERIQPTEAGRLLNTRINGFDKYEALLSR